MVGQTASDEQQIAENLGFCTLPGLWDDHFVAAEPHLESQWNEVIWPAISGSDFDCVAEIGPGAGRNSARLAKVARSLRLVDVNEYPLDHCRTRFSGQSPDCEIHYDLNDGLTLPMLPERSVTFVYSWDSMVHFDQLVVRSYPREFARVMRPGRLRIRAPFERGW